MEYAICTEVSDLEVYFRAEFLHCSWRIGIERKTSEA
jgi:hypothetical protein